MQNVRRELQIGNHLKIDETLCGGACPPIAGRPRAFCTDPFIPSQSTSLPTIPCLPVPDLNRIVGRWRGLSGLRLCRRPWAYRVGSFRRNAELKCALLIRPLVTCNPFGSPIHRPSPSRARVRPKTAAIVRARRGSVGPRPRSEISV
ncbi:hypothetical protein EVAR_81369_1 [Eumeta japonica]|uniref:Uncharacterized protein n=1 Tax=Eumeta variegata TaxID=151549 RepID=A0A4C1WFY7_EUMVA|nr:hypothetical protein EVAR_81369_1 [Eumeta japonica]